MDNRGKIVACVMLRMLFPEQKLRFVDLIPRYDNSLNDASGVAVAATALAFKTIKN